MTARLYSMKWEDTGSYTGSRRFLGLLALVDPTPKWYTVTMNTRAEKFGGGLVGFCRWVADRYDFWVVHRGRRLRPEVAAEIEESLRKYEAGDREGFSPSFYTVEDAIAWLDGQCEDEGGNRDESVSVS